MRTIKFRAWNKQEKKMRYLDKMFVGVGQLGFSDDHYVDLNSDDKEDVELMQYTSLKDRNGREIFEGDIVIFDLYKGERIDVIEWETIAHHTSFGAGTHNATVIGNIYENPELLS